MVQVLQGIRTKKPNPQRRNVKLTEATSLPSNTTPSHEINIRVKNISKLYTYDIGRFPVLSRSENQYIIFSQHCGYNAIIATTFKSRANKHRPLAYGATMKRLKDRSMLVDLQLLDKEASTEYKLDIKAEWGV